MKTNAMILVITGAFCSLFVGMMYGFSYLKGPISDLPNTAGWKVGDAGEFGFMGQYAAFVPGISFANAQRVTYLSNLRRENLFGYSDILQQLSSIHESMLTSKHAFCDIDTKLN